MIVKQFMIDTLEANVFVAWCKSTRDAMLIDCGQFREELVTYAMKHQLNVTKIFVTHGHHDHVEGLSEAVKHFGAELLASSDQVAGLPAKKLVHGSRVQLGRLIGTVSSTPGHTPDGISIAFEGHVFTGDALFAGSVGGTATPELAELQRDRVRQNIFTLPDHYVVHCGHGPSTTIEIEKNYNPFFV